MMEEVRDVHTKGGRMWLFEALNEARHAAKDCGVDDKAPRGMAPPGIPTKQGETMGKPWGNHGETNGTAIKSGGNGELRVEKMLRERERVILRVETMLSGDLRRFRNKTWWFKHEKVEARFFAQPAKSPFEPFNLGILPARMGFKMI